MTRLHSSPFRTLIICVAFGFKAMQSTAIAEQSLDSKASDDASLVKPFVGETTFLVVKIDPKRIGLPDAARALDLTTPEATAAFNERSKTLMVYLKQLQTLADGQPIFATIGIPESKNRRSLHYFCRKTSDENAKNLTAFIKSQFNMEVNIYKDYLVAVPRGGTIAAVSAAPDDARQITAAFKAVADYPAQLLILPPGHVWRTIRELSPELPRQLGGGPSRVLTDGVQWASIGFDPQQLRMQVVIQSASDEAARTFAAHLPTMLHSAYEEIEPLHSKIPEKLARLLVDAFKPQVDGSQLKIHVEGLEKNNANLALWFNLAQVAQKRARRHTIQQRFRQILLAIHTYVDAYHMLPPADKHRDQDGKHRLSWRVHILPFIEQQALYNQFRLDEAWDSPHNRALLEKMPDVYSSSGSSIVLAEDKVKIGYTTFLAPIGEKTMFGGAKATKFQQITDGTSNTIALLEVTPENAVPWTAPDDFSFDPTHPLDGVLMDSDGKWLCGFADGSVHQLNKDMPVKSALYLFQMNDGHPIDFDTIR